mgnify:CR=1 FL=1
MKKPLGKRYYFSMETYHRMGQRVGLKRANHCRVKHTGQWFARFIGGMIQSIEPSPRLAAGRVHRKDKKAISSSLPNPAASGGECARYRGSISRQSLPRDFRCFQLERPVGLFFPVTIPLGLQFVRLWDPGQNHWFPGSFQWPDQRCLEH